MKAGEVYVGDCLEIMQSWPDGCVDLIYADPPYCTGRDFGEFDDRWPSFESYLEFMRERLVECHRVLSETGSMYLHVDPSVSHYLKVEMDGIFGRSRFRNEIVWSYYGPSSTTKDFQRKHDVLLRYVRGSEWAFNAGSVRIPYKQEWNGNGGSFAWMSKRQHPGGKVPDSVWGDLLTAGSQKEKCLYPTQKPVRLLERIIKASSNAGDVVLDPFCGSGTALVAAEGLGRKWVGIDVSAHAAEVSRSRLIGVQRPLVVAVA